MTDKTMQQLIEEGNGIAAGTPDHAKDGKIYDCYGRQLETVKEMEARHKDEHFWCNKLWAAHASKDIENCLTGAVIVKQGEKIQPKAIREMYNLGCSPEAVYKRQTVEGKIEFPEA